MLDYLGSGDVLGEKSFLDPVRSSQAVARTLSPVTMLALRKSEFLDRLTGDRRFAMRVVKSLALRMDRCEEAVGISMNEPVERRLALLLLRFTPEHEVFGFAQLPFNLTNRELAKASGTTRWRVAHFMARFQRLGWLRRQDGLWVDREKLVEFLKLA